MKQCNLISQTDHKYGVNHTLPLNAHNIEVLETEHTIRNAEDVISKFVLENFAVVNNTIVQMVDEIYLRVQLMSFTALLDNAPNILCRDEINLAFANRKRMNYSQKTVTVKYTVELVFSSIENIVDAPRIEVTAVCVDDAGNEQKDTAATFVYPEIACAMFMFVSANKLTEKHYKLNLFLPDEAYDVLWRLFGMKVRGDMVKGNFWRSETGMYILPMLAANNAMAVYKTYHSYLYYALSDYVGDEHTPEMFIMDSVMLMNMYSAVIQSQNSVTIEALYNDIVSKWTTAANVKVYDNTDLAEAAQETSYSKVVHMFNTIVRTVLGETDEDGFAPPQADVNVCTQHLVAANLLVNNTDDALCEISEVIVELIKASKMKTGVCIPFNSLIKVIRHDNMNTSSFLSIEQAELVDSIWSTDSDGWSMVSTCGMLPFEGLYGETMKLFQHRTTAGDTFKHRFPDGEVTYDNLQDVRFEDFLEVKTDKPAALYRRNPELKMYVSIARTEFQQDYVNNRSYLDRRVRNQCHADELSVRMMTTLWSVLRELEDDDDQFSEAYGDQDTYLQLLNKILTSNDEYVSQYPGIEMGCGLLWYSRMSLIDSWGRYYHPSLT